MQMMSSLAGFAKKPVHCPPRLHSSAVMSSNVSDYHSHMRLQQEASTQCDEIADKGHIHAAMNSRMRLYRASSPARLLQLLLSPSGLHLGQVQVHTAVQQAAVQQSCLVLTG